jgi:hypothetical protein
MADLLPSDGSWGEPVMQNLNGAPSNKVVSRFYRTPAPLTDGELMRYVVAGGQDTLVALTERLAEAQPQQVLALCAVCQYYRSKGVRFSNCDPVLLLTRALQRQLKPEFTPALAVWLGDGADRELARHLCCLLARCGGDLAAEELQRVYAAYLYPRRTPPQAPFPLPPVQQRIDANEWVSVRASQGGQYALFTASGLVSSRDLYLGYDSDGDNELEDLWFTGLSNTWYMLYFPGGRAGLEHPAGPLNLRPVGQSFDIWCHEPVLGDWPVAAHGYSYKGHTVYSANYRKTRIELARISKDSDSDGLPDNVERELLLDALLPDTDGDGMSDGVDPLPNVNQGAYGMLERGIQRAMVYEMLLVGDFGKTSSPVPWQALYCQTDGAAPVAISLAPGGCGIAIANQQAMQQYEDLLSGFAEFSLVEVLVTEQHGIKPSPQQQGGRREPRFDFSSPQALLDMSDLDASDYAVTFTFPGCSDGVWLVRIGDELYPAAQRNIWIS